MAIIYSYPQGTPTLSDNVIGSQIDPITEENKTVQFTVGQIAAFANSYSLGYTVYTALVTQAGTAAPVATILQNTTGGTITWTRTGTGEYTATIANALFTLNKTLVFINNGDGLHQGQGVAPNWTSPTTTTIDIDTFSDGALINGAIEIRVYA
jgi:hypothetical protein